MDALLTIILDQESDELYQEVKNQLLTIKPDLSISPYIEYNGRKDHIIFNVTLKIALEELEGFIKQLTDQYEGELEDLEAFNNFATMFNEHVYYIGFYIDE